MEPGALLDGRFAMETVAGRGGMAVVYRAVDERTGLPVAIKVLQDTEADAVLRFEREVRVLASLEHPAIVRLVGTGRTPDGKPFLAMEWLDGEELSRRLRRERIPLADAVALGRTLASALASAHEAGVVHRDVKPANVLLVGADPRAPKLLDFGVARVLAAPGATRTGITVGTPRYMAPEQARGDRQTGARADTFALACVLYECLTGAHTWGGHDMVAVLAKILLDDPVPPRSIEPAIPEALEQLLLAMLAKEPDQRPAMREVAAALAALDPAALEHATLPPAEAPALPAVTESELGIVCALLVPGTHATDDDETLASSEVLLRKGRVGRVLDRFEAAAETLADGSLIATFRGRGSARDQAMVAARAGLALRDALPERAVAIATGRSAVRDRVPLGEALDRVAELGRIAPAGRVYVDGLTAALLDERFELRRSEHLELLGEVDRGMEVRRLLGRPTPFVGRDRELRHLEGGYEACLEERAARAILVTGPAGSGKSRLRHELLAALRRRPQAPQVWIGRGDPTRTASPGHVVTDALRRPFGLSTGEEPRAAHERIRRRVREKVGADAGRVTVFLAELLGVPFQSEDAADEAERVALRLLHTARRDAVVLGDQLRRAAEDLCEAESRTGPLVLVLEDLHWADPAAVRMVDGFLRVSDANSLYVVALARPEVDDAFPSLWRERRVERVALPPLGRRHAEVLARAVLGEGVAPALVTRAVELAAGNAFYLEEVLRAVAEGEEGALPETVLAMVQSRLEAQSPAARRVLRAASVFGGTFWVEGVQAMLGDEAAAVTPLLDELAVRELVTPRSDSRFLGRRELTFRHAVVRDAAYASLTERDRTVGHGIAGRWLEAACEPDAAVVAEHLELGGDTARAQGHWHRAATQALAASDLGAVLAHVGRALACDPPAPDRGALLVLAAEAHRWRGEFEQGEAASVEALVHLAPGSALHIQAAAEAAVQASRRAAPERTASIAQRLLDLDPEDAVRPAYLVGLARIAWQLLVGGSPALGDRVFDRIDALAPAVAGDPTVAPHVALARGHRARWTGDGLAAAHYDAVAARLFAEAGDLRSACNQQMNVGFGHLALGRLDDAEDALRGALHTALTMGLSQIAATARHNLGLVLAYRGRLEEALLLETQALEAFEAMGDRWFAVFALVYRSLIHALAGDLPSAIADARSALHQADVPMQQAYAHAALAQALLAIGQVDEASRHAAEAFATLPSLQGLDEVEALVRAVHREALEAAHRTEEADEVAEEGRAWIGALADKIGDAPTRAAFLALPVHARLCRAPG